MESCTSIFLEPKYCNLSWTRWIIALYIFMFYLINKPLWISSFDVIRKLRRITGIKKMGHTGTLDPLAAGCLLIATENSTKLIPLLEKQTKTYIFEVDISLSSDSLDLGTPTTIHDISSIRHRSPEELRDLLLRETSQIPPKYSALHIDGKRAYDLVRTGIDFEIPSRPIEISDVKILDLSLPRIQIQLSISAGGYIRSLAPVIALFFGIHDGGCITRLQRTRIQDIDIHDAQDLEYFDVSRCIEYTVLFPQIPLYTLDTSSRADLLNGKNIPLNEDDIDQIFVKCGDILSLGRIQNHILNVIRNHV
jgi:tRNA pseudouridine55 synthase